MLRVSRSYRQLALYCFSFVILFIGYRFLVLFVTTSSSSGLVSLVLTKLSPLVPFLVGEYILKYEDYLDNRNFAYIPIDGQHQFVYDSRYAVDHVIAVRALIKRWSRRGGRGAVLRIDSVTVPSIYVSFVSMRSYRMCRGWRRLRFVMQTFATRSLRRIG